MTRRGRNAGTPGSLSARLPAPLRVVAYVNIVHGVALEANVAGGLPDAGVVDLLNFCTLVGG